jgi:hypothetical protein
VAARKREPFRADASTDPRDIEQGLHNLALMHLRSSRLPGVGKGEFGVLQGGKAILEHPNPDFKKSVSASEQKLTIFIKYDSICLILRSSSQYRLI